MLYFIYIVSCIFYGCVKSYIAFNILCICCHSGFCPAKNRDKNFSSQREYVTSNIFPPILEIRIGGCIYVNFTWFYWSINIIWFYFDDMPPPLLL